MIVMSSQLQLDFVFYVTIGGKYNCSSGLQHCDWSKYLIVNKFDQQIQFCHEKGKLLRSSLRATKNREVSVTENSKGTEVTGRALSPVYLILHFTSLNS